MENNINDSLEGKKWGVALFKILIAAIGVVWAFAMLLRNEGRTDAKDCDEEIKKVRSEAKVDMDSVRREAKRDILTERQRADAAEAQAQETWKETIADLRSQVVQIRADGRKNAKEVAVSKTSSSKVNRSVRELEHETIQKDEN